MLRQLMFEDVTRRDPSDRLGADDFDLIDRTDVIDPVQEVTPKRASRSDRATARAPKPVMTTRDKEDASSATCKLRPRDTSPKKGGSRPFVPWCKKRG